MNRACSLLDLGCSWGYKGLEYSQPHPSDAPWCGHCKALAPEYSKAAALLAAESAAVTLAKVDGPAEPELTKEFGVVGYPTLKFFQNGNRTNPEEYVGMRRVWLWEGKYTGVEWVWSRDGAEVQSGTETPPQDPRKVRTLLSG